jgi:hypothetical protein
MRSLDKNIAIIKIATESDTLTERAKLHEMYDYYDSLSSDYNQTFSEVLGENKTIYNFILSKYHYRLGDLVGIELGGPAINLFRE